MNMDDLIEQLDEVLDTGMKLPGKRVIVDIEKVRAIVDDMRMTMPTEIKQAKGIVADRAYLTMPNVRLTVLSVLRKSVRRQWLPRKRSPSLHRLRQGRSLLQLKRRAAT